MSRSSLTVRALRVALRGLGEIARAGAVFWGALALWIDGPASRPVAAVLAGGLVACAFGLPRIVRPRRRGAALGLGALAACLAWWLAIPPRQDRDWQVDVARTPTAELRGDRLTIHGLRNFDHRSEEDFTERWESRTFDLAKLRGLDLFISFWGSPLIGHTIMSWEFDDGRHLAISIETRKEKGESYSAVRGFFRQFELYYVVADERDVIRLRTNFRGEQVYLYRLATPPEEARALLLAYVEEFNRLALSPKWYNAVTHNCTTTIRLHVRQTGTRNPWSWRILVNGYADELLYMRGLVNQDFPFPELKARSLVSERARGAGAAGDFSARIRSGLPPRPPAR